MRQLGQKKIIVSGHFKILNWRYGAGFFYSPQIMTLVTGKAK